MNTHRSHPFVNGLNWRVNLARECIGYFRLCKNWREVIAARRRKRSIDRIILRSGQTLFFHGDEIHALQIFREVWAGNEYILDLPVGYSLERIIDIGGHFGFFSMRVASLAPQAEIHCYEPSPLNAEKVRMNCAENGLSSVRVFEEAVGKNSGFVEFDLGLSPESGRIILSSDCRSVKSLKVECIKICDVLSRFEDNRISLIKLDCEGSEYDIVADSAPLLAERTGFVTMEYHDRKTGRDHNKELISPLVSVGFRLVGRREIGSGFGVLSFQNQANIV